MSPQNLRGGIAYEEKVRACVVVVLEFGSVGGHFERRGKGLLSYIFEGRLSSRFGVSLWIEGTRGGRVSDM